MIMQPKVLITGIRGFTGHYLAAELAQAGYAVFGTGSAAGEGENYFQADLEDEPSLKRVLAQVQPQIVVHLAALAYVGQAEANAFHRVNLIGTRNLLEAVAEAVPDVRCVLLASSANVYGNVSVSPVPESAIPQPASDYAVSKLAMEQMARLWQDRLPIVIVRPFNYTGVGQDVRFVIPKIVAHYRQRKPMIELGNLHVRREYNDVRSVVQAYRRLIERCPVGETINLCTGRGYSLGDALALAEELSGHRLEVRINPTLVRTHEVHTLTGDNSKLISLIGNWDSLPLRETLVWMLARSN